MTSNFFKVVLAKSIALSDIGASNPRVSRFVQRAKQCGFQTIIEEDLPRLTEVTDYESFGVLVKNEKKADSNFAQMLKFIPDLKWSLDESLTTIGYVYHQVSELHVLYSYANSKSPAFLCRTCHLGVEPAAVETSIVSAPICKFVLTGTA